MACDPGRGACGFPFEMSTLTQVRGSSLRVGTSQLPIPSMGPGSEEMPNECGVNERGGNSWGEMEAHPDV